MYSDLWWSSKKEKRRSVKRRSRNRVSVYAHVYLGQRFLGSAAESLENETIDSIRLAAFVNRSRVSG